MEDTVDQKNTVEPGIIAKLFDSVLDFGKSLGMLMIFLALIGICSHVFLRYFFGRPINWVIDVSTLFMFFLTFLGSAWLLREDGHVSLDFLYHTIGPRKYRKVEIVTNSICALACLVVAYYGIIETLLAIKLDMSVDMPLAPPKWIVLIIVPLGFFMLAAEFLRKVFTSIKKPRAIIINSDKR